MVRDIPTIVVCEAIRRIVDECAECVEFTDEAEFGPYQEFVDPEHVKRAAALNNAVVRITESSKWN